MFEISFRLEVIFVGIDIEVLSIENRLRAGSAKTRESTHHLVGIIQNCTSENTTY